MHEWKNLREDHLCRNLEYPAYGMWTDLCVSLRVCRARDKWHGMGDGCDTAAALHHGFEAESDPVHASGHGDPEETKMKSAMPVMNAVVFVISILIGIILDIMLDYPYLDKKGKIAIGIAMVGILAINVFVYVATYQLNKSQKLLMENQLLRMSQEEQKEGMERMMRLQEKNRMLRHDLRHYFTLFQEMLANGNVEEAQKYVEDVLNTKLQPEGVYMTGDEILDAVLNHCDGICRQKQITFRTEISAHLPEGQMEFAIALLNLLENAIEAEELEEDKLIELQIYESAGLLLVTVRNRISQSVMENNPELRTRKADASLHGLGRKSVKKLIRDMEGSFYEEERNGFFISNIVV